MSNHTVTPNILSLSRVLYSSLSFLALLGLLLLAGTTTARADSDSFVLTDGTNTMTWTLPSSPTPDFFFTNRWFQVDGVTVLANGSPTTANITFYNNPAADGGLSACNSSPTCSDLNFFDLYDFQVFSGTTAAPTFIPGTYTDPATEDDNFFSGCTAAEQDNGCGVGDTWALSSSKDVPLVLEITTVPEPSSIILLGSGLMGLVGMGLRRRRIV